MHHSTSAPLQKRSLLHPMIWAVYFVALIGIAYSFDVPGYSSALPSTSVSHLAAVFGLASFQPSPCSGSCGVRQIPSGSPLHSNLVSSSNCAAVSIYPDLGSGCGFGIDPVPSPGPSPDADISAAPSETLTTLAGDPVAVGYRPPSVSQGISDAAATP